MFVVVVKRFKTRRQTNRKPWSASENSAVHEHLGLFIRTGRCPGKKDCDLALRDSRLVDRDWKNLKYHVKNMLSTIKGRSQQSSVCWQSQEKHI